MNGLVVSTQQISPNVLGVLLGDDERPICLLIEPEAMPGAWYFVPMEGALYSAELLAVIYRRLEELNEMPSTSTVVN